MPDSDSPKDKKSRKHLSQKRQLRSLLNALLDEEGVSPKNRLRPDERAWGEGMLKDLDSGGVGEARAGEFTEQLRKSLAEPSWLKKTGAQKTGKPVSERQHLRSFLHWVLDNSEAPPTEQAVARQMLRDLDRSKITEAAARDFMEDIRKTGEPVSARQKLRGVLDFMLNSKKKIRPEARAAIEQMIEGLDSSKITETAAREFLERMEKNVSERLTWTERTTKKPPGPFRVK